MKSVSADILRLGAKGKKNDSEPLVYAFASNRKTVNDLINWIGVEKDKIINNLNQEIESIKVKSEIQLISINLIKCKIKLGHFVFDKYSLTRE